MSGYRILAALLLSLVLLQSVYAVDDAQPLADARLQTRYENLARQLRCLVCQNETIADSSATLAGDLRRELREKLVAGQSDEQILQFMTDRYGAFVLYKPPFEQRTWLLWLGPVLLLLIGVTVAFTVIRRRARMAVDAPDEMNEGDQA